MIRSLLSRFSWFAPKADSFNRLTRSEVELITMIRHDPATPLQGAELAQAQGLVSRGMLKSAGARRFLVTEKAVAACRKPRG